MKDILDKLKKMAEGEKVIGKIVPFCKENKRYLGAAALFACFVLVLVFFTGDTFNAERLAQLNSRTVSGEDYVPDAEFEVNAYAQINELISEYLAAYAAADFTTLEMIANPISEMEKSYITTMSPFYEAYENITCYTKHGLSKDSYIVSACFDIKFAGVEEAAPSMVLFYVQTADDGSVYINNLYSDFNMMYAENQIDKDVYTALRKYTTQDDYIELYNEVEAAYQKLMRENNDVYQMTRRTIPGTRQVWEDTVYYADSTEGLGGTESTEGFEGTESTETTQSTEGTEPPQTSETEPSEAPQTPEPPAPSEPPEPVVQKIKIVNVSTSVNIREKASTESNDIGDAYNGDVFVKLGEETDSSGAKWMKIQFDGDKVGYIRADYTQDITQ